MEINRLKVRSYYDKSANFVLGLLSLALILIILFGGREIGVANNGDFRRVMGCSSLVYEITDVYQPYAEIETNEDGSTPSIFQVLSSTKNISNYPSIHLVFVRLAVVINMAINAVIGAGPVFRMAVLGVINAVLYAALLTWLFKQIRLKNLILDLIAKLIIILVACDVGYVAYFNSLYSESVQILAVLFCANCAIRLMTAKTILPRDLILAIFAAVLYGWSKFVNIPAGALICLCFGVISFIRGHLRSAVPIALAGVAVLAAVYIAVPSWMDAETNYNAIFFGILRDTDDETGRQYLQELGLDPELIDYAGTNAYVDGVRSTLTQEGLLDQVDSLSKLKLLFFYLEHPLLYLEKIAFSIENSGFIRPHYLSNYDESVPAPELSNRFSLWSGLRVFLGFDLVYVNLALLAAFTILMWHLYRKTGVSLIVLYLTIMGAVAYQLLIQYVANGEGDIQKHMFAYAQLIDLIIVIIGVYTLHVLGERQLGSVPVTALMLTVILIISPVAQAVSYQLQIRSSYDALEQGAYLSFGSYDGEEIVWMVADVDSDGTVALLCVSSIADMAFSDDGYHYWPDSSLRQWLNSDFLSSFDENELSLIQETEHELILSYVTKDLANTGDRDFYYSVLPAYAGRDAERAYKETVSDTVSLPDITLITSLYNAGYRIADTGAYWLETPYFGAGNSERVRVVDRDGYIYMRNSIIAMGVRPVIYITGDFSVTGKGSINNPLILINNYAAA